jgi:hypothetical protein
MPPNATADDGWQNLPDPNQEAREANRRQKDTQFDTVVLGDEASTGAVVDAQTGAPVRTSSARIPGRTPHGDKRGGMFDNDYRASKGGVDANGNPTAQWVRPGQPAPPGMRWVPLPTPAINYDFTNKH